MRRPAAVVVPALGYNQRVQLSVLIIGACLALAAGQSSPPPSPAAPIDTPHLTVSYSLTRSETPGRMSLVVDVAPKPKMHVYAPDEKEGIPVSLAIDAGAGAKAGAPVFPPPQKYFFAPLKLTQLVYSKPFRITVPVTLGSSRPVVIKGTLRYQACDDSVCYMPKSVPLTVTVMH